MALKALLAATLAGSLALNTHAAIAEDKAETSKDAHAALASLYAKGAGAKALGAQAHGYNYGWAR